MDRLDLRISKQAALVLYELLRRYEETSRLEPLDPAERAVLMEVLGALERAEGGDLDPPDWQAAVADAYAEYRRGSMELWGPTGFPPNSE